MNTKKKGLTGSEKSLPKSTTSTLNNSNGEMLNRRFVFVLLVTNKFPAKCNDTIKNLTYTTVNYINNTMKKIKSKLSLIKC